jgi:Rieske Fe-S protein
MQGDPTYLIVKEDTSIENYGLNAVCTHLGCVVPWVSVSSGSSRLDAAQQRGASTAACMTPRGRQRASSCAAPLRVNTHRLHT